MKMDYTSLISYPCTVFDWNQVQELLLLLFFSREYKLCKNGGINFQLGIPTVDIIKSEMLLELKNNGNPK